MDAAQIKEFTSWLGKRSYAARLKKHGLEQIQKIARENGKKGGRPKATASAAKKESN